MQETRGPIVVANRVIYAAYTIHSRSDAFAYRNSWAK